MSKRKTDVQGSREGAFEGDGSNISGTMDRPGRATAAQLANRKIKGARTIRRASPGPASASFPSPSQQQNNHTPQSIFGNGSSTFGTTPATGGAGSSQQQQQQQQGTFGFGQQGGGPFGVSQSFPPNDPSASSSTQQGSQSTLFGGFGGGGSNPTFGGPSSEFSFTTQNQNNPFTSSNGAAPSNFNSGVSGGFKGTIFNIPGAEERPADTSSQAQPQASNSFFFGQPTQAAQDRSAGPLFGQQSTQSQFSQTANNPFASASTQSQQPLNSIFGPPHKEPSQVKPATSIFSQATDSMQTSPDTSPHKVQELNNGSFSIPSPPIKALASTPTKSGSNPFGNIAQPPAAPTVESRQASAESSDGSNPRISQSSSTPSLFPAQGQTPSTETFSVLSQPATVPFTSLFPRSSEEDFRIGAQGSGKASLVSASADLAPAHNPFAGLKVPTISQSATTQSPEAGNMDGNNTQPVAAAAPPSFGLQNLSPSITSAAVSSTGNHKSLSGMSLSIPDKFTDAQKRSYATSHRLRSLNASFTGTVVSTSNTANITSLLQFYLESHEEILEAGAFPGAIAHSNKRKADEEASNHLSSEPGKKLKLGTSVLGRPLAASPAESIPKGTVAGAPEGSSSNSLMFQSQAAGDKFSSTSKQKTSTGFPNHEVNGISNTSSTPTSIDQVSYPSLPDSSKPKGGSQTANIFKNILDKADQEQSTKVSEPIANGNKAAAPFSFHSNSSTAAKPPPSSTSMFSVTPSPTPQATPKPLDPDKPVFQLPTFGTSTPNFLAQFTSTAQEAEQEAREKRKAEDFDSDDDNEEDWERKDAEQQRAKKKKIAEMSKGKVAKLVPGEGFTFESDERPGELPGSSKLAPIPADETGSGTSTSFAHTGSVDFKSRASGPTPSTFGGASIFDAPKPLGQDRALSITNNIFGHLSDADSGADGSKTGDADDEDTASEGESETDENTRGNKQPESSRTDDGLSDSKRMEPALQGVTNAIRTELGSDKADSSQDKPGTSVRQPSAPGRSLFDRISKDQEGNAIRSSPPAADKTPANPVSSAAASSSVNVFGQSSPSKGNSLFGQNSPSANLFGPGSSPVGDHTFKHDSPIKFGSTAAPSFSFTSATPTKQSTKEDVNGTTKPFATLFGAPKAGHDWEKAASSQIPSTLFGSSLGKSTDVGFGFGGPPKFTGSSLLDPSLGTSAATSRASSPGAATDTGAESANDSTAEGAEEESHIQLDLTNGGPGEEDEDVLYEVRAKAMVFKERKYESKGVGFLRVLKHRETGKVRILLRQDPNGKLIINAALLSGVDYTTKGSTSVSLPIPTEQGTLKPWIVRVGKAEDAADLAKVLESNKSG
ncbi:MAG: hypothetical protein M1812_003644 [Candelaria pacifica]|nr:MAG: hypothetical protein M1812_003644 [Candelaria pacifica]